MARSELAALECLKELCFKFFLVAIHKIIFKLASGMRKFLIDQEFLIQDSLRMMQIQDFLTGGCYRRLVGFVAPRLMAFPDWDLLSVLTPVACNEDIHNILDEFKFQPYFTTDCRVSCP